MNHRPSIILLAFSAIGCTNDGDVSPGTGVKEDIMASADLVKPSGRMHLTSTAFQEGGPIPQKYTMYGANVAPALEWSGAPPETASFALLCTDPDAMRVAGKEWVHWAVVDIPAGTTAIPEGGKLPAGARQLRNSYGKEAYGGPQPPAGSGVHHYIFALYPLTAKSLAVKPGDSLSALRDAVRKEALDMTTLIGTYEKK